METMKPGRELDALVAEKVMGIQKIPFNPETHVIIGMKDHRPDWTITCPNYSTDISAAWDVVKELSTRFNITVATIRSPSELEYQVSFYTLGEKPEFKAMEYSESESHAICLAALKAVGIEV